MNMLKFHCKKHTWLYINLIIFHIKSTYFLLFLSQWMAHLSAHLFTLEICKSPSVPLYPLPHISNQETDLIYSTSCYFIPYFNVQISCYDINRSDITPRGVKNSYFGKGKWWLILFFFNFLQNTFASISVPLLSITLEKRGPMFSSKDSIEGKS